jgi:hypothetical protein
MYVQNCGIWNFQDPTGTHRKNQPNNDQCLRGPGSNMGQQIGFHSCFPSFPQSL